MTDNQSNLSPAITSPASRDGLANKLGYVLGGLSFVPLVGVPFGVVAIILGITRRTWSVVKMGAGGIAFTFIIYSSLFYVGVFHRGGISDSLRADTAVKMMNTLVKEIEFYKLQQGYYPQSTSKLSPGDSYTVSTMFDPTCLERKSGQYFYYELDPSGKFYYLRSVGADGVPFTSDDLLPSLSPEELKNTGLRIHR